MTIGASGRTGVLILPMREVSCGVTLNGKRVTSLVLHSFDWERENMRSAVLLVGCDVPILAIRDVCIGDCLARDRSLQALLSLVTLQITLQKQVS